MFVGMLLICGVYFMVWLFLVLLLWCEFWLFVSVIGLLLVLVIVCGVFSGIYIGWLLDCFGCKCLIFFGISFSGFFFVLLGFSGQLLFYGLVIFGVSIGCVLFEFSCKVLIGDCVEDCCLWELVFYCWYFLINFGVVFGLLIGLIFGVVVQVGIFLVIVLVYFCYGLLFWCLLYYFEFKWCSFVL